MAIKFYRLSPTVLLASFVVAAFPALAYATHSWNNYHWARASNPFVLQLGDNVSSGWDSFLMTAASNTKYNGWSWSGVLDLVVVTPGGVSNPKNCKGTKGRVEVCATTYGNNGWLGLAQIWLSGSHITQGVVKLNDTYFNTAKYNTPAWRNLVMCQEVGHTLGLDHQDETFNNSNLGTCMDYTNDPTAISPYNGHDNEFPNDHDYDELAIIYGHLDGTTTVGQTVQNGPGRGKTPPVLADLDSDEPVELGTAQWGKLIRSTNRGRTEIYELDLGGGHKVLTRVIWVEPESEPGPQRGRR